MRTSSSTCRAVACALFLTLCAPGADADDSSAGVMLPGLRSYPAGSLSVSAASLVTKAGRIELTLTVTVQRSQGSSVTLQMPRFGWLGEAEPYPDRHFPELKILVDGVPATVENSFAAFVGSTDVTEAIRKAGVDPFAIAGTPPLISAKAGAASAIEALERLAAVQKYQNDYLAQWSAARKVAVKLSAGSHTLTVTYQSRPGFGMRRLDQITRAAYLARYCLTAADLTSALGRPAATQSFAVSEHNIPSSIDSKPPPSLSVDVDTAGKAGSPRPFVAFCGADGKAVIGQASPVKAPARADGGGTVRILSISAPSLPR